MAATRKILDGTPSSIRGRVRAGRTPGWHPLVLRTRKPGLFVRARSGYIVERREIRRCGERIESRSTVVCRDWQWHGLIGCATKVRARVGRRRQRQSRNARPVARSHAGADQRKRGRIDAGRSEGRSGRRRGADRADVGDSGAQRRGCRSRESRRPSRPRPSA